MSGCRFRPSTSLSLALTKARLIPKLISTGIGSSPNLKVLKSRNIIPDIHEEQLVGVSDCSLWIGSHGEPLWRYVTVIEFLNSLPNLKRLDISLHGDAFSPDDGVRSPSPYEGIEYLRIAFPGMSTCGMDNFLQCFSTPNKRSWTLEFDDTSTQPLGGTLKSLFPDLYPHSILSTIAEGRVFSAKFLKRHWLTRCQERNAYYNINEFTLIIRGESGKVDYNHLKRIPVHAKNLERFSVSYLSPQNRRFELMNCRGKVGELVDRLDGVLAQELTIRNSCLFYRWLFHYAKRSWRAWSSLEVGFDGVDRYCARRGGC